VHGLAANCGQSLSNRLAIGFAAIKSQGMIVIFKEATGFEAGFREMSWHADPQVEQLKC
jgi:hypothetical protein